MAQERLLGANQQESHDVVADAGEALLHLGPGEVGRCDALEALSVGLLLWRVVAAALGHGVHEDELSLVHGDEADAVRAMRPASSRTSMHLCSRYARIASCVAVCPLGCVGASARYPRAVEGSLVLDPSL